MYYTTDGSRGRVLLLQLWPSIPCLLPIDIQIDLTVRHDGALLHTHEHDRACLVWQGRAGHIRREAGHDGVGRGEVNGSERRWGKRVAWYERGKERRIELDPRSTNNNRVRACTLVHSLSSSLRGANV